ncbi:dihydroxyacetone kinase subunit DhaK [Streptomyces sp. NPDC057638]|uniref:dihydroxyacetone kinase subunit DhaK n=1 Tax=Streptomyces sp. NPDC057638 TaxID=3346190 RepID=UPI003680FA44
MSHFLPDRTAVLTACQGLALAYPDIGLCAEPLYLLATRPAPTRRVALVSGGGAGHEPLHTGLLGRGGLDAVVPGAVFTSPSGTQIEAAMRAAAALGGRDAVLLVVKNYTGDRINFSLAADRAVAGGLPVAQVVVADDLATSDAPAGRRGTGATLVVEKLLGALADQGADLDSLVELGERVAAASRSLAVCARAHTSPAHRAPAFQLAPGALDYGVGIHGERAARTLDASGSVDRVVTRVVDELLTAVAPRADGVIALVSGLGGTSELELRAISALVHQNLTARGVRVQALAAGSYVTALDMAGFSVTLTALEPGWTALWTLPTRTPLCLPGAAASRDTALAPAPAPARRPARAPILGAAVAAPEVSHAFLDELHAICSTVHADLTALDQATGDGDFGDNFCGGVYEAARLARRFTLAGATALADTFRDHVGGSSGPLFGMLFTALAPSADRSAPDVPALAAAVGQALADITTIGGAVPGDCTLVDALAPAAHCLATTSPADIGGALTDAARAAITGAHATAVLTARRGRASYTGDHAAGQPDPGAVAVALILTALARVHEPAPATRLPPLREITRNGAYR